jgi:hypothetical protein
MTTRSDICLSHPRFSYDLVWCFKGCQWPTRDPTETFTPTVCFEICSDDSDDEDLPRTVPDIKTALVDMRAAYESGEASFFSDTVPPTLTTAWIRSFILQVIDQQVAGLDRVSWSGLK